jgi:glycerol uptake facilitator-like aquaporin
VWAAEIGHVTPARVRSGLARRAFAELLGTALLLAAVVGSGIAAQRLSPQQTGLELLENSTATAAALVAIILALGPVSGAHLNPVVTLADRLLGSGMSWSECACYWLAQVVGAIVGVIAANLMFGLAPVQASTHVRIGPGLWLGEVVATFGLLLVIFGVVRSRRVSLAPFAVGAYIGGAYWFTSSTSFANPAVTVARMLSDTFAGITPLSAAPFVAAQIIGALAAVLAVRQLYPGIADPPHGIRIPPPRFRGDPGEVADQVVVPHGVQEEVGH